MCVRSPMSPMVLVSNVETRKPTNPTPYHVKETQERATRIKCRCGVRSIKCRMWSVKCKVWSVKCGVWSVKC